MVANRLKVQIAVSMQLQKALHDPSRGISALPSETISSPSGTRAASKTLWERLSAISSSESYV